MGKRRPDRIRRCRALCGDRRDFSALSHPGNANETSARQVYMSYSEATLKYPELSQPIFDKIKADPVEVRSLQKLCEPHAVRVRRNPQRL